MLTCLIRYFSKISTRAQHQCNPSPLIGYTHNILCNTAKRCEKLETNTCLPYPQRSFYQNDIISVCVCVCAVKSLRRSTIIDQLIMIPFIFTNNILCVSLKTWIRGRIRSIDLNLYANITFLCDTDRFVCVSHKQTNLFGDAIKVSYDLRPLDGWISARTQLGGPTPLWYMYMKHNNAPFLPF